MKDKETQHVFGKNSSFIIVFSIFGQKNTKKRCTLSYEKPANLFRYNSGTD